MIEGRLQKAQAQLGELESNLKAALDLIEKCYDAYCRASDPIRRTYNQAFWERIRVGWDEPTSGDLAEPFQIICRGTAGHTSSEADPGSERNSPAQRRSGTGFESATFGAASVFAPDRGEFSLESDQNAHCPQDVLLTS